MGQELLWFKTQLKERKFQVLVIMAVCISICLTVEFCLFSYSILKIIRYLILLMALFLIAWIDGNDKRIPNRILWMLLGVRVILLAAEWAKFPEIGLSILFSAILGLLIGGGMFLLAHFISKNGIGMGDVKLLAVIGSYLGSGSIMTAVFLTVIISAVYSIIMLGLKKITLKEEIPFAPFVLAGTILTMALGM